MGRAIPSEMSAYTNADLRCSFGWTNASYLHGLSLLDLDARRALGEGAPYEAYAKFEQGG